MTGNRSAFRCSCARESIRRTVIRFSAELPSDLPRESHRDMQRLGLGTLSLNDPVEVLPPDTRHWAEEYARRQVGEIQDRIFPLHGL